jgi:hypothetical protein
VQTSSTEGRRIAALLSQTDQSAADADVERSARIIDLSRQADALAARRASFDGLAMGAQAYAAQQNALYQAALRALNK